MLLKICTYVSFPHAQSSDSQVYTWSHFSITRTFVVNKNTTNGMVQDKCQQAWFSLREASKLTFPEFGCICVRKDVCLCMHACMHVWTQEALETFRGCNSLSGCSKQLPGIVIKFFHLLMALLKWIQPILNFLFNYPNFLQRSTCFCGFFISANY